MEELFTPVSRTYYKSGDSERSLLQEISTSSQKTPTVPVANASSPDDVAQTLKDEPDYETLISVLKLLVHEADESEGFSVGAPGPQSARIIQILVTEIVPNYWTLLKESSIEDGDLGLGLLLSVLRNLAGLNAILLRIRTLIQEKRTEAPETKRSDVVLNLNIALELLCKVLDGDDRVSQLWETTVKGLDATKRRILSREFISILGGGRVISLSAEGDIITRQESRDRTIWTAVGVEYSKWLTLNIVAWSEVAHTSEDKKIAVDLLSKTMHLGYSGRTTILYIWWNEANMLQILLSSSYFRPLLMNLGVQTA